MENKGGLSSKNRTNASANQGNSSKSFDQLLEEQEKIAVAERKKLLSMRKAFQVAQEKENNKNTPSQEAIKTWENFLEEYKDDLSLITEDNVLRKNQHLESLSCFFLPEP